ncbi:MAG: ScpA family protein [Kangiellaceae bacterium]|jgi:segregation and condensation protein A|nr:ScpA family protein [Kangiellaceae bacterium]
MSEDNLQQLDDKSAESEQLEQAPDLEKSDETEVVSNAAVAAVAPEHENLTVNSEQPVQEEMAFALINGEPVKEMPKDLYIPPDALEVFLEAFEGPLDLLLYLIRRQNLDITNIPIAHITEQYMEYVELMKGLNLELAAEYLVMASVLCEIKSRVLLPRPKLDDEDEVDPRADLIRRLQEYERFKKAAEDIDEVPRMARDIFPVAAEPPELNLVRPQPEVDLKEILLAFKDVLKRADMFTHHHIEKETLSVREKMTNVLARLSSETFTDFVSLFTIDEGRMGVVVTFLSIMELSKEKLIELVQNEPYGVIHVRARGQSETDELLA